MANLMILFGSGGHSSEMLMLIQNSRLNEKLNKLNKITCVISEDDKFIEEKLEHQLGNKVETVKLKRGRRVGQSYLTAVWTTIVGILHSFHITLTHKPDLCVTNGPAISVTIALAIRCLRFITLGLNFRCELIYVESFCRTRTLSLSGKIIYHLRLADQFYVQWPILQNLYPRAQFKGILV